MTSPPSLLHSIAHMVLTTSGHLQLQPQPHTLPPSTIATDETSATHPTCNTVTKTSKKQREQTWKIDVGNENATVGEYSVLKNTGREGGGGDDVVYQVLEGPGVFTYEAPVPAMASPAANQPGNTPATNAVTQDEEYSTLKY